MKDKKLIPPIHPGEVLKTEFLDPLEITPSVFAIKTGIEEQTVKDLIEEKISLDDNISLKISKFFGTGLRFWLTIQKKYEEDVALFEKMKKKKKEKRKSKK